MKSGRHGFTMVELLIALAITSILLVAVTVAFNASIINFCENEDIFKTVNSARQALSRIINQLRTAQAVEPNSPANQCKLITANGDDITYQYDSAENKVYLVTNDDTSDSDYVLCNNVAAMTFNKQTVTEDSVTFVKSVQVSITVQSGNTEKTLCSAVAIRKNLD